CIRTDTATHHSEFLGLCYGRCSMKTVHVPAAAAPVVAAVAPGQAWNSLGLEWPERGPGGAPACGRQQSTPGRRQRLLYFLGYYSDACTGEARTHACLAACIFIAANII
uniref:Uncharacterized protein n=1 Tax=Aegilops tauschii subsp. strangulata TaxID=200361 RepID=A0A453IRQ5_AEGTS